MTSISERISFLKKIHLFSALTDDDLKDVAEALVDESFKSGDVIIREGTTGDKFYAIYRGTVKVTRKQ